jgi:hypothetical protein
MEFTLLSELQWHDNYAATRGGSHKKMGFLRGIR